MFGWFIGRNKGFQPNTLPNLQLWLDANRIGVQGYSLDFDGTNDEGEADNEITAYPFTMECWFNKDRNGDTLIGIYDTTVNNKMFRIRTDSNGKLQMAAQNTTDQNTTGANNIPNGIWTHVAAVYSSATDRKLYVNGIFDSDANTNSVAFTSCTKVGIGVRLSSTKFFYDGKLSDVRIWNTARTAQEIADNYQKRLIGNESGLVGYWKLDKGSGTTVEDSTSNANTGTITGAIWDNSEPLTEAISDNTAVRVWADQSGNAYNAEQSTSAARPTYRTNQLNGLPAVVFDGTDDRLSLVSGALGMLRNVAGATVFAVVRYPVNSIQNISFFISNGTNLFAARLALLQTTINNISSLGRRLDANSVESATSAVAITNTYLIHSAIAEYSNAKLFQYRNGTLDGTDDPFQTTGNTSDTNSQYIGIGANGVPEFFLNGAIAEIIVYNRALNTSELAQVHSYLSRKWGIALA